MERLNQMTKSIEEQAREFVKNKICFNGLEYSIGGNTYEECVLSYIVGAKARDAQWYAVVNELRVALKFYADKKSYSVSGQIIESIETPIGINKTIDFGTKAKESITKADQLLREMGKND